MEIEITPLNVNHASVKLSRVLRFSLAAPLLAGLFAFAGCKKSAGTPASATAASGSSAAAATASDIDPKYGNLTHALPKLPTIKVWLGDQVLDAEIASTPVETATGMMFRTNAPEDQAMIFVYPRAGRAGFYMRNCFVPLSGAYIGPNGEIQEIIQMKPHDETVISSKTADVQFVLETAQGWFDRHHISTGAVVRTERGSLRDTFFGNGGPASR